MTKKTGLVLVLSILLVLMIAVAAVFAVSGMKNETTDDVYLKKIELGTKYVNELDYESAISVFDAAISLDPDNDEAYYQLAYIYVHLNNNDMARSTLAKGIEFTRSAKLANYYYQLFNEYYTKDGLTRNIQSETTTRANEGKEKNADKTVVSLNSFQCSVISNYTYNDYDKKYSLSRVSAEEGTYAYYSNLLGATFYFFNEDSKMLINENTQAPYDNVRPNYVKFKNLSIFFTNVDAGGVISLADLKEMGAVSPAVARTDTGKKVMRFTYSHCMFEITVDDNDSFTLTAENKVWSEYGTNSVDETEKTFTVKFCVVDAVTNNEVNFGTVTVCSTENRDRPVAQQDIDNSGFVELDLAAGDYIAEVTCENFVEETFEFTVFSTGACSMDKFVISPVLASGTMRIVLEWGEQPVDLDSHFVDDESNIHIYYGNREHSQDGNMIVGLDVDDVDGYGPETTTVYDLNRNFSFYVVDFTGSGTMFYCTDITVKVYMDNQSSPVIYNIDANGSNANVWHVFDYSNGNIVSVNSAASHIS